MLAYCYLLILALNSYCIFGFYIQTSDGKYYNICF